jgi:uncharacterized protein YkwD
MRSRSVPYPRLALLCALAALGGCGGGGGSAEGPTGGSPPPAPAPSPAPPAPAPAPVAGTRATCNLANFQAEMLALVNQHRTSGAQCGSRGSFPAVGALNWNDSLAQASLVHSDDMVAHNFFSHTGSDGSSAGQRISAAGYSWRTWGENIAAGQPTVASVVAAWMNSDGHCANLMNPNFRELGVVCVAGGSGNTYRTYWTQKFGAQR